MFKIAKTPTFRHEVTIKVPVDGGFENQTIGVVYRVLDDEAMKAHEWNTLDGQKAWLRAVIARLDDMVDEDGKALAYNDGVRDQVIALSYARGPLMKGYTDAMIPALVGNSDGLALPG